MVAIATSDLFDEKRRPPELAPDLEPLGSRTPPRRADSRPADRDAISSRLMRYCDERGDDWADIIDMLTMQPEARRRVVRLLGELSAER
jgi:hypothetical protein